jgi:DNA-binding NtrC family response regulator
MLNLGDQSMKHRLLVVDDEQSVRELYRLELEGAGFEVRTAADSGEVLDLLEKEHFHLIILDVRLKGESGLDLLQRLTDLEIKIPVIISSAYSTYRSDFSSWLAEGYVVKSPDLIGLLVEVRRVLEKHHGKRSR